MTLRGMNILLMGASGTGKTTALRTLLDVPGLEVFGIFTDPRFDILGGDVLSKIHYTYIPPATASWQTLVNVADQVNKLGNDALQNLKSVEPAQFRQYIDVLSTCNNFKDQHGVSYGDITSWSPNRIFFIDGLTGLSKMGRNLRVGAKSVLSQPDWGVAMNMIQQMVDILTMQLTCHFVLIAHVEREFDEVANATKLMVSTMGRKLAPILTPNFGDVVLTYREGTSFFWDTTDSRADVKSAFAGFGNKLPPSFVPLFNNWKKAGGVLSSDNLTTK